jgi:FtsH-binding integral membrane protein
MWSVFFMLSFVYPSYFMTVWYYNLLVLMMVLLFVLYLLFDLTMIVKHYPTDEYMMAAVNLYIDILYIFLYILMLLGGSRK